MSQNARTQYVNFLEHLESKLGKIDLKLATDVLYYERNFTDVEPKVELAIHYRQGSNLDKKKFDLESRYLVAREGEHGMKAVGLASLEDLMNLSSDPDVDRITGFATCASY
ncbi:MAG: hypothetical protein KGI33_08695 [Thaumarchaeota archaeon]|nr:hypothetical protein [Nitrososphaerota archaeon]